MLERAEGLAQASDCSPHKLGALIFKRKRILGRGFNKRKSHPLQAKYNRFSINLHAEVDALIDGLRDNPNDIHGASIAIARKNRRGDSGCSMPCSYCYSALYRAGIRRIVCYDRNDQVTGIDLT